MQFWYRRRYFTRTAKNAPPCRRGGIRGSRELAVLLLNNQVLPFYKDRGLKVAAILTLKGKEYCGKETHPYEFYLALAGIEHRTKVEQPRLLSKRSPVKVYSGIVSRR